ncbi:MAG: hypothetical protein MUO19_06620 [Dehalococcoidales bacterium]|nr:hypothetical protein [Dehalococcoidales bacterium]
MDKNSRQITVLDPRGQPSGIFGRRMEAGDPFGGGILNPDVQPKNTRESMESLKMAPRLDTLEGKTVYLVNTGFAGGKEFMEEVQNWFTRSQPSVKTELRHKQTSMFSDEPELWKEIKENGDAVVFGVGG